MTLLALIGVSPLRAMLLRKRIGMWRHHAADALARWLFGEPMPRTAAGLWRVSSWFDGERWIAYVWRGDEWHGAGFGLHRDDALRDAISEARGNVRKRRVGRKSGANT
jgi:hypothetical protein